MSDWLESARDPLAEPDPGATPFLADDLLADGAIGAIKGLPKVGKIWIVIELACSIATGRAAFDAFAFRSRGR